MNLAEHLIDQYRVQRYLLLPQFISTNCVEQLLKTTEGIEIKRVICGDKDISFGEQRFPGEHAIYRFFGASDLVKALLTLTQAEQVQHLVCWTSIYRVGQYINAHTDRGGTIQVLVCLQAPAEQAAGGTLVLQVKGDDEKRCFLTPGDAIVFEATSVSHYTTPLRGTETEPMPRRVVAVGRYYM
jgi:hypothetical protein